MPGAINPVGKGAGDHQVEQGGGNGKGYHGAAAADKLNKMPQNELDATLKGATDAQLREMTQNPKLSPERKTEVKQEQDVRAAQKKFDKANANVEKADAAYQNEPGFTPGLIADTPAGKALGKALDQRFDAQLNLTAAQNAQNPPPLGRSNIDVEITTIDREGTPFDTPASPRLPNMI